MMSKQFEKIFFDLDGTLYSSRCGLELLIPAKVREAIAYKTGWNDQEVKSFLTKHKTTYANLFLAIKEILCIDPNEIQNLAFSNLDITSIEKYSGIEDALYKLSESTPLSIATNSHQNHATRVLKFLGIERFFDEIFSPAKCQFHLKPSETYYRHLLSVTDISPEKILIIDDSYHNVSVAKNLGFRVALVSNQNAIPGLYWEMHSKRCYSQPEFVDYAEFSVIELVNHLANA